MSPILIARFWSKVRVGRDADCWPWQASTDRYGYGQFKGEAYASPRRSHRVAFELANAGAPPDLLIRHTCHNPACCNPAHLIAGTPADNHKDREEAGRCLRENGRFAPV